MNRADIGPEILNRSREPADRPSITNNPPWAVDVAGAAPESSATPEKGSGAPLSVAARPWRYVVVTAGAGRANDSARTGNARAVPARFTPPRRPRFEGGLMALGI